jgi:hypothetical protein
MLIAAGFTMGALSVAALPSLGAGLPTTTGGGQIPPIHHVWTIILENSDEAATLAQDQVEGEGELTSTLAGMGADIPNYYSTGHSSLDNYIALTSGQGPTEQTQGDCTDDDDPIGYPLATGSDTAPDGTDPYRETATLDQNGQALGDPTAVAAGKAGCTYAANVPTLGMQLTAAGYTWKTYAQGEDSYPQTARTTCQSAQYAHDLNSTAANSTFADNYARKHDPELYFYGVTGLGGNAPNALCDQEEVGLDQLPVDLQSAATTPTYSLIIPDLCNDAHDSEFNALPSASGLAGCKANSVGPDGQTAATSSGVEQADNFLKYWVPRILDSPAYQDNGLLLITFDEGTEALSCCHEIISPNLPSDANNGAPSELEGTPAGNDPALQGGGIIGMVAISPFITPGTVSTVCYNHYSYLRTMEDMFDLTPARTKGYYAQFPDGIQGSDGEGHIGFAGSQIPPPGSVLPTAPSACTPATTTSADDAPASFGSDIFTNPSGAPGASLPDSRLAVLLPISALLIGAAVFTRRQRRRVA